MYSLRGLTAAAALMCAAAAAGCGLGPGQSTGEVELRVTRDYGTASVLGPEQVGAHESDTVIGLLDKEADVTLRYGDNFVQSIDGVEGTNADGRLLDWFFYVNGVESPRGGADVTPAAGDRIWWDYRDWSSAMRVPAVVGDFPAPFLHGYEGKHPATRIDCLGERAPCDTVRAELEKAGVDAGFGAEGGPVIRVLVGPWSAVERDRAAAQIDGGPQRSGVFARFSGTAPGATLSGLSADGQMSLGPFPGSAGLVAAVRYEDDPPTWVVTGAAPAGVAAAARAFSAEDLDGRYAVIAGADGGADAVVPVPNIEAGT
jgi:uncharacterized protein DUF4430